jgi:hypothetical protein
MDELSDENYLGPPPLPPPPQPQLTLHILFFLVATDLPILLNDLMKQINTKKPENPWQYSAIYFKKYPSLSLYLFNSQSLPEFNSASIS